MESNKTDRSGRLASILADLISKYIARHIQKNALITVSRIILSPKGTSAKVYISIYPEKERELIMDELQSLTQKIKKDLGIHSKLRNIPNLIFELDSSSDLVDKIDRAQK